MAVIASTIYPHSTVTSSLLRRSCRHNMCTALHDFNGSAPHPPFHSLINRAMHACERELQQGVGNNNEGMELASSLASIHPAAFVWRSSATGRHLGEEQRAAGD